MVCRHQNKQSAQYNAPGTWPIDKRGWPEDQYCCDYAKQYDQTATIVLECGKNAYPVGPHGIKSPRICHGKKLPAIVKIVPRMSDTLEKLDISILDAISECWAFRSHPILPLCGPATSTQDATYFSCDRPV